MTIRIRFADGEPGPRPDPDAQRPDRPLLDADFSANALYDQLATR